VLFWLDSTVRERHLQTRLTETDTFIPVATGTRQYADRYRLSPAEDVWWLHGHPEAERRTLADLGRHRRLDRADLDVTRPCAPILGADAFRRGLPGGDPLPADVEVMVAPRAHRRIPQGDVGAPATAVTRR
jgi:hypothetical protein